MITIKDMLNTGADTLQKAGVNEFRLDAWYLLSYCIGISRAQYFMKENDEVSDSDYNRYMELISQRTERKPLQYITGNQEFMGISFEVNENVLIPRQDTELLVELALKYVNGKNVLDMCTGSGCIAVSLAKLGKPLSVTASDISPSALQVAKKNAANNNVDITFVNSNLWDNIEGNYDILVSNPPYIDSKEMLELMPEVSDYEPHLALEGGTDGLDYYRSIIENVNNKICDGGLVIFEIGCNQGDSVRDLLTEQGLVDVKVEKDLAGLDRVVWGRVCK